MLMEERDLKVPPPLSLQGPDLRLSSDSQRVEPWTKTNTRTVRYGVWSCLWGFINGTEHGEPLLKQSAVGRDVDFGSEVR